MTVIKQDDLIQSVQDALQHISYSVDKLKESTFEEGIGFDGSSIRGFQAINESDMLLLPDPATAFVDPFCAVPTLSLTCNICETGTREAYERDPRSIAQKAEKYLASTGVADTAVLAATLRTLPAAAATLTAPALPRMRLRSTGVTSTVSTPGSSSSSRLASPARPPNAATASSRRASRT